MKTVWDLKGSVMLLKDKIHSENQGIQGNPKNHYDVDQYRPDGFKDMDSGRWTRIYNGAVPYTELYL